MYIDETWLWNCGKMVMTGNTAKKSMPLAPVVAVGLGGDSGLVQRESQTSEINQSKGLFVSQNVKDMFHEKVKNTMEL